MIVHPWQAFLDWLIPATALAWKHLTAPPRWKRP